MFYRGHLYIIIVFIRISLSHFEWTKGRAVEYAIIVHQLKQSYCGSSKNDLINNSCLMIYRCFHFLHIILYKK